MEELLLTKKIIEKAGKEATNALRVALEDELVKVILYGSCARGDFNADSDLDIALITKCDRVKAKNYVDILAEISTELAMKYFIVVNFVAVPEKEFQEKKGWYQYFKNIESEGIVLYES